MPPLLQMPVMKKLIIRDYWSTCNLVCGQTDISVLICIHARWFKHPRMVDVNTTKIIAIKTDNDCLKYPDNIAQMNSSDAVELVGYTM